MAKKNKKKVQIPQKKVGYIERRDNRVNAYRKAEQDTTIQFMTDMLILTLNDPEVMGKDVFGKKRLVRVIKAWGEKWDKYHVALENGVDHDYYQVKLDQALKEILGDDLIPFAERYDWLSE